MKYDSKMALNLTTADYIQTAMLGVVFLSVLLLAWQTLLQNRILKAQLLKDRFEMYWRTYDPVSEGQIQEFKLYPEDYMERDRYEKSYKNNDEKIRRYIYFSMMYEYLAFTQTLKELKLPDPLGESWVEKWVNELSRVSEFQEVHEEYKGYYPALEVIVDRTVKASQSTPTRAVPPTSSHPDRPTGSR